MKISFCTLQKGWGWETRDDGIDGSRFHLLPPAHGRGNGPEAVFPVKVTGGVRGLMPTYSTDQ